MSVILSRNWQRQARVNFDIFRPNYDWTSAGGRAECKCNNNATTVCAAFALAAQPPRSHAPSSLGYSWPSLGYRVRRLSVRQKSVHISPT